VKRLVIIALALLVLIGGLYGAMRIRAPKAPPPGTQEIWADQGVPVTVGAVRMGDMEDLVEVTGDINALNRVTLSAKVSGRVAKVFVREGDPVAQGMTVVLLDSEDAGSALEQAQAGLETAKLRLSQATTTAKVTKVQTDTAIEQAKDALSAAESRLAVVKKPTRSQEQMMAENALASAKASLENAEANYKRNDQLLKEGAISQAAFDQARAQFTMAQAEHKSAGDRLQMIKEGGRAEDIKAAETQVNSAREQLRAARANASQYLLRQEDIKQAEAGVRQAKAALALAEQQLSYTAVKSPIAGRLASRLTEPGQVVAPGQSLGEVVDLSSLYFKGEISEKELTKVRKGQQVRVRIDAMPDRAFAGFVKDIYPAGSTTSRNFPVRVVLAGGTAEVRPGMFARGGIVTGYARNVMLVPKDAVEERKGASMVFTIQQKRVTAKGKSRTVDVARRLDIDVVRVNTHSVQVRQPIDLRPGQRVVTQGRQNMQNGVKVSVKNGF
jgi:RND family efflux transporter MFP subunit